ncbi:FHA domain-containing protein [Actinomarinicola tropica]|uniref:FHA domain-containing protein n=1 Tax=Actinomarinicola tropica TaxID=2789776 RepID=UPI0018974177|nr:FHA domain-containing protein [Actinomarinicola tropica]
MARARPRAEETRYRSVPAPGWSAGAVADVVVATLRSAPDLVVSELAPDRIGVARTRRPRWASVACVATIWLGGLGLLFLLVRQTEAGEVAIHDGPRGCSVLVPPILDLGVVDRIADALRTAAEEPPAAPGTAEVREEPVPVPDDDALDARTVARSSVPGAGDADEALRTADPEPLVVLRFEAGEVRVAVGERVVLGRDPSSSGPARSQVVPGDATTVSKSHLLVVVDAEGITLEDLGSTNGSAVLAEGGERPLDPGVPLSVRPGERVRVGAAWFTVSVERGGADGPLH